MLNVLIIIIKKVGSNIKKWQNFSRLVGKKIHRGPVYEDNGKYIKTKIKICRSNVNTHFLSEKHQKKILHVNACH